MAATLIEILLVEDSQDDLDMALRALRKVNLCRDRIQVARDGVEAMDFIFGEGAESGHELRAHPKVILLDLKLPKVGGLEVLRRIKTDARTKSIPVVVLTSSREQSDVQASYNLGVNSFVVKPVNFEHFAAAISEIGKYWLSLNHPPLPALPNMAMEIIARRAAAADIQPGK